MLLSIAAVTFNHNLPPSDQQGQTANKFVATIDWSNRGGIDNEIGYYDRSKMFHLSIPARTVELEQDKAGEEQK